VVVSSDYIRYFISLSIVLTLPESLCKTAFIDDVQFKPAPPSQLNWIVFLSLDRVVFFTLNLNPSCMATSFFQFSKAEIESFGQFYEFG